MAIGLLYPPTTNQLQKTLNADYTAASGVLTLNNATFIQNKPGTCCVNRIDTNGNPLEASGRTYYKFTGTSGNTLVGVEAIDGSDQDHAIGQVVEFGPDVDWAQGLIDTFEVEHDVTTGVHTSAVVTTLKATAAEVATATEDAKIVTPLAAAPYGNSSLSRQALINGNFDVWQRGTTGTLADITNTFVADRWWHYFNKDGGTLPTITVSRQVLTADAIPGSYYYHNINWNGTGSSFGNLLRGFIDQKIEHGTRFLCGNGKKVTLSFWAKSDIANKKLGVTLFQQYGTGGTPTTGELLTVTNPVITLTSSWTKYTFTITTNALSAKTFGTANDDHLQIKLSYVWNSTTATSYGLTGTEGFVGAGNVSIAQVQLCAGDVALPFQPKSFEEELKACQRYYEKSYDYAIVPGTSSSEPGMQRLLTGINVSAPNYQGITSVFKVSKRSTPTIKTYDYVGAIDRISTIDQSTSRTNGVTPSAIAFVGIFSFYLTHANTNEAGMEFQWTADAEL